MNDFIDTWIRYLNMKEKNRETKVNLFLMRAVLRRLKAMAEDDNLSSGN